MWTNRRGEHCSRCGAWIEAGAGELYKCIEGGSCPAGNPDHFDEGGWHVDCVDRAACKANHAAARAAAKAEDARETGLDDAVRAILEPTESGCTATGAPPVSGAYRTAVLRRRLQAITERVRGLSSAQRKLLGSCIPNSDEDRTGVSVEEVASQMIRDGQLGADISPRQRRTAAKLVDAGLVELLEDRIIPVEDAAIILLMEAEK